MNASIRFRRIREEVVKKSQKELAEILGISEITIRRYETGKTKIPKAIALALEALYGINHKWLLTGEGDMFIKREQEYEHKIQSDKANIHPELANFLALLPEEQQKQLASIFKEFLKTSSAMPSEHISPHSEEKRAESDRISESK